MSRSGAVLSPRLSHSKASRLARGACLMSRANFSNWSNGNLPPAPNSRSATASTALRIQFAASGFASSRPANSCGSDDARLAANSLHARAASACPAPRGPTAWSLANNAGTSSAAIRSPATFHAPTTQTPIITHRVTAMMSSGFERSLTTDQGRHVFVGRHILVGQTPSVKPPATRAAHLDPPTIEPRGEAAQLAPCNIKRPNSPP